MGVKEHTGQHEPRTASTGKQYEVKISNFPKNKTWWISILVSMAALVISGTQFVYGYQNDQTTKLMEQAQSISAWISDLGTENYSIVSLNNMSNSPVYDVVITTVRTNNGEGGADDGLTIRKQDDSDNGALIDILPPGKYTAHMEGVHGGMNMHFGVEIAFRDYNNNSWIITADGHLKRISKNPFEYYGTLVPDHFSDLTSR